MDLRIRTSWSYTAFAARQRKNQARTRSPLPAHIFQPVLVDLVKALHTILQLQIRPHVKEQRFHFYSKHSSNLAASRSYSYCHWNNVNKHFQISEHQVLPLAAEIHFAAVSETKSAICAFMDALAVCQKVRLDYHHVPATTLKQWWNEEVKRGNYKDLTVFKIRGP
jgi:hypothetical protein